MSAQALNEEDCPDCGWSYLAKTAQQSDDNEQFYIDRRTLNGFLRGEIILQVLMEQGIHNWDGWEEAMDAVSERLKGETE